MQVEPRSNTCAGGMSRCRATAFTAEQSPEFEETLAGFLAE
jgi:hypothetical protein